jgi:catalase
VDSSTGDTLTPEGTLETMPSCTFDALVIPDGAKAARSLSELGQALEFVKDQYRHCKAILVLGAGKAVLDKASIPVGAGDPALIVIPPEKARAGTQAFMEAVAKHRNWGRATDPPRV